MIRLNRAQTKAALTAAGWSPIHHDLMVAIGAAESSLRQDVTSPANADGTHDYGLWQINGRYVTGSPHWDQARLLSDAAYNAAAALTIWKIQGFGAWYAYVNDKHVPFLPPSKGGPPLGVGAKAWFLVSELQAHLNAAGAAPQLVADGAFGQLTLAAVQAYKASHPIEGDLVGSLYWQRMGL